MKKSKIFKTCHVCKGLGMNVDFYLIANAENTMDVGDYDY